MEMKFCTIIGCWVDDIRKEKMLLSSINSAKKLGYPIILVSHKEVNEHVLKEVDYFIYDKNNPILTEDRYEEFKLDDSRWIDNDIFRIEVNPARFHHDYAVWTSWRNSFNFAKSLGFTKCLYLEYDCEIDSEQVKKTFIDSLKENDIVYYDENKSITGETCNTFIFSGYLYYLCKITESYKSIEEYFSDKSPWILESRFFKSIKDFKIKESEYLDNEKKLNQFALWNRESKSKKGAQVIYEIVKDEKSQKYFYIYNYGKEDIKLHLSTLNKEEILDNRFLEIRKGHWLLEKIDKDSSSLYTRYLGKLDFLYEDMERIGKISFKNIEEEKQLEIDFFNSRLQDVSQVSFNKNLPEFKYSFLNGAKCECINGDSIYTAKFFDGEQLKFECSIKKDEWCETLDKTCVKWRIEVYDNENNLIDVHQFDLKGKKVYIWSDSSSLGDNIAWVPYAEEFKKLHNCEVFYSCPQNELFEGEYEVEFLPMGSVVDDLYAMYQIGYYYNHNFEYRKSDPRKLRLQEVACDILGLEFKEIRPRLAIKPNTFVEEGSVSISTTSTASAKYWHRENGWKDLIDNLKEKGYSPYLVQAENDYLELSGIRKYLGNKNWQDLIDILNVAEFHIGLSSGLSWLAWALGKKVVLISGMTDKYNEFTEDCVRIISRTVCNSCWNDTIYEFDKGDWFWCPKLKGTDQQFICSKDISVKEVLYQMEKHEII